jgi:hypothetical protein
MTLRITPGNHLKLMVFNIIGTVLMIVALYFFRFDQNMMKIFLIIWLIYTVPALYLHLEYYFKNRGQELKILDSEIVFQDRNGKEKTYKPQDLEKAILYKSASLDRGGLQLSAIESYHYARIIPKEGEEIIITCLMTPNVEEALKQIRWVPYERKKRLFASLNFSLRLLPDK